MKILLNYNLLRYCKSGVLPVALSINMTNNYIQVTIASIVYGLQCVLLQTPRKHLNGSIINVAHLFS